MTFIRQLFQSLLAIFENFTEEDAWVLLCAAGVSYFVPENLGPKAEETHLGEGSQDGSLLGALCLEADCPNWTWKSRILSASFRWKREADLDVRDWIYLA
jgi:hypothetical protein